MSRQPYIRPLPKTTWYLRKKRYRTYMLRELTCLLVAAYCFMLIWGLAALASPTATRWNDFLAAQQTPAMFVFHSFSLLYFMIYQTFAWFELAPKAMPIQLGEKKSPDSLIVGAHYLVWAVLTAVVFFLTGVF